MKSNPICTFLAIALVSTGLPSLWRNAALADSQTAGEKTTELYANQLSTARPYPISQMNDSTERTGLTERLLRMNNPNKLGYVTLISSFSQVLTTFTIKGKVSSTASQLTPTKNIILRRCGSDGKSTCAVNLDSMSDDGSFGPAEGGKKGIFFFTTGGVLIESNLKWQYSDSPTHLTTTPVVFLPANAKPSTDEGFLLGDGQK